MNTEALQNKTPTTTGGRLRQARENMGLSQKIVAERLCLKVSTVRDIEDDHVNPNLASTFLRGYIRSYARLVHIPEEELISIMSKQILIKTSKVGPIHGLSLDNTHKKRNGWLIWFTWLILFVVISLTSAWWWQNRQAQQQYISNMANQSSAYLSHGNGAISVLLGNSADDISHLLPDQSYELDSSAPAMVSSSSLASTAPAPGAACQIAGKTSSVSTVVSSSELQSANVPTTIAALKTGTTDANGSALIMTFTDDCWLEVFDAGGKKLFSGIQHSGARLNFTGHAPYKLKIGAPAAVQVQYRGKPVNLNRFIRANQVARLTIAAH